VTLEAQDLGEWVVPAIVQRYDQTGFWWIAVSRADPRGWRFATANPGLLDSFLALKDGTPDSIVEFASKSGVLGLCEHGLPQSHGSRLCPLEVKSKTRGRRERYLERFEHWRALATRAAALVALGDRLRIGDAPNDTIWRQAKPAWAGVADRAVFRAAALSAWPTPHARLPPDPLVYERGELGNEITAWLSWAWIQPSLYWGESDLPRFALRPAPLLSAGGLFAAIALQLAERVAEGAAKGRSPAVACAWCGKHVKLERRLGPKRRRQFCGTCRGSGRPAMMRQRERRARKARGRD
jgi:hypothetical protein